MERRRQITAFILLIAGAITALLLLVNDPDGASGTGGPAAVAMSKTPVRTKSVTRVVLPHPIAEEVRPLRPVREPMTELEARVDDLIFGTTEEERLAAIEALAAWVPGEAEQALANASRTHSASAVREAALEVLFDASSDTSLEAFAVAFTDADEWVRIAAENGLYDHDDSAAAQGVLAEFCRSEDEALRVRAAELLDEITLKQLPWDEIAEGPTTLAWAVLPNEDEGK